MIPAAFLGTGLVLAYMSSNTPTNLVPVKSQRNNRTYQVQNLPDKQAASEVMANIHDKLNTLIS